MTWGAYNRAIARRGMDDFQLDASWRQVAFAHRRADYSVSIGRTRPSPLGQRPHVRPSGDGEANRHGEADNVEGADVV